MNKLQTEGFSQYNLADILSYERLNQDLTELTECFESLPEDPYAKQRVKSFSQIFKSCHFTN